MRLTTVILIATLMQVSAATFGQRITINERKASFEQVLKSIRSQSGYDVIMDRNILKKAGEVNISVKDATIDEAMKSLLSGLPLKYTIDGKIIVIEEKSSTIIDNIIARFQAIDVRGKVVDSLGNGLPGATVSVKNGKGSTSTDAGGNFLLKNVEEGAVLVVSYLGYVTREVAVSKEFNYIALQQSASKLDEVQVQAYGVTSRRLATGNISTVKAVDIEKQPVGNPLLALQGRVPGLTITQSSGLSNSGVTVMIQGQNSLLNGNEPFYVIDGVPYSSQLLPNLGGVLGLSKANPTSGYNSNAGNPLNYINPADIESIDVLKDADATAIYGSRAANGAIIITTKRGKAGETKVDIRLQSGISKNFRSVDLLDTKDYLIMRREAYSNDGRNVDGSAFDLNGVWDSSSSTNWQKELIGGSAGYQDGQFNISSGTDFLKLLAGVGFHREQSVFSKDFSDKKGVFHISADGNSLNNRLQYRLSANYLRDDNRIPNIDLTSAAISLPPNAPSSYNSAGTINWGPFNSGDFRTSYLDNPVALLENKYFNETSNFSVNTNLSYQITGGLKLSAQAGYRNLHTDERIENPSSNVPEEFRQYVVRSAKYGVNNVSVFNLEPQINYTLVVNKGKLDFLLGTTFQKDLSLRSLTEGSGYVSDDLLVNMSSATSIEVPENSSINTQYKYNAVFGRLNYNLNNKYIVNLTGRRDGSSRFGSNNKFQSFASFGAAWIFSNENLFNDRLSALSFGKLRASYGSTGNDQIGDYSYLNLFSSVNPPVPYRGGSSLAAMEIANPDLQWELTRKLAVGLDLGFLNDKLLAGFSYFRNRSSNQLLRTALPGTVGMSSMMINLPATIQNSGWELTLSNINLNRGSFRWTSSFNITIPKNTLLRFTDLESSVFYANDYQIGKTISSVRVFNFAGVDSQTGIYQFYDKEGNLTNSPSSDFENRSKFINTAPRFYGGLQNSIQMGRLSVDFTFQFTKQMGYLEYAGLIGKGTPGQVMSNQPRQVLSRWKAIDDLQPHQKFTKYDFAAVLAASDVNLSDASWVDASFVRLKNLSVSYDVARIAKRSINATNAKLFINSQNLLLLTNYRGLDPEGSSYSTLPPLTVISGGIQLTF